MSVAFADGFRWSDIPLWAKVRLSRMESSMTNLPDRPNTALLVIDVQNGVVSRAHNRDGVIANINTLVDKARAEEVPVAWVQHSSDGVRPRALLTGAGSRVSRGERSGCECSSGLRTNRSGWVAKAVVSTPARLSRIAAAVP